MANSKFFAPETGLGKALNIGGRAGAALLTGGSSELGYQGAKMADKAIKGRKLKPIKTARDMLASDLEAMKKPGQLGLTDAEIGKRTRDAQQAAVAGANAQASDLAQASLAGQGFQAGAMSQAGRESAEAGGEAAAKASSAAHDASRQIQEREMGRIRRDLEAQTERARENTEKWAKFAVKAGPAVAMGIANMAGGNIPGALANFANAGAAGFSENGPMATEEGMTVPQGE